MKYRNRVWIGVVCAMAWSFALSAPTLVAPTLPTIPNGIFRVTDYGAIADGVTDNTLAIQAAIDKASLAGGGTVQFSKAAKAYESGPLTWKSGIRFQIDTGATLQMLPYGTYPLPVTSAYTSFVLAQKQSNLELTGGGTIDGQGSPWWAAFDANNSMPGRPIMFNLGNDTNVWIHNITVTNAPAAHFAFKYSVTNVTIQNLTINAPATSHNTDGIDMQGTHYLIEKSHISDGDDNIAIGPTHQTSSDITIQDCFFGTGHGLSIGSGTLAGLDGLLAQRDTFEGTTAGIRLKSGRDRGGLVQNLTYSDIVMNNVSMPIYVSSYYPTVPAQPDTDKAQAITVTTPFWKNVTIKNMTSVDTAKGSASIRMIGLPEAVLDSFSLIHVAITAKTPFIAYHVHNLDTSGLTFNGSSINAWGTQYDVTFRKPALSSSSSAISSSSHNITVSSSSSATLASSSSAAISSSATNTTGVRAPVTFGAGMYIHMRNGESVMIRDDAQTISLLDLNGHIVMQAPRTIQGQVFDLARTNPGLLILRVQTSSGTFAQVIINR